MNKAVFVHRGAESEVEQEVSVGLDPQQQHIEEENHGVKLNVLVQCLATVGLQRERERGREGGREGEREGEEGRKKGGER